LDQRDLDGGGTLKEVIMQTTASSSFVELTLRLIDVSTNWFRRVASVNKVASLDSEELSCIARELGISAAELRVLAKQDRNAAALLYRRMEQLRLSPNHVDIAVLRDLQRCCSNCDSKQLCAHEFEDRPRSATWPQYCPNEQTLAALSRERQGAPASSAKMKTRR
jgi:Family of unknown function (DUF6455)